MPRVKLHQILSMLTPSRPESRAPAWRLECVWEMKSGKSPLVRSVCAVILSFDDQMRSGMCRMVWRLAEQTLSSLLWSVPPLKEAPA